MNIFKDNNDWNEKSIIGFVAFTIMCLIMVADLLTGWVGKALIINEFAIVPLNGDTPESTTIEPLIIPIIAPTIGAANAAK